jgi:hypothetical protein
MTTKRKTTPHQPGESIVESIYISTKIVEISLRRFAYI